MISFSMRPPSRRHIAPMMEQVPLDELEPREMGGIHVEPFQCGDLVKLVEKLPTELVGDAALDEGDAGESLAARHRLDFVQHRRWVDDRRAGRQSEPLLAAADLDAQRAAFIAVGIRKEDGAGKVAAD